MSAKIIIFAAFATTVVFGQDYASNPTFSAEKFEQTEHEKIPVKSYAQAFPNPKAPKTLLWLIRIIWQIKYFATLYSTVQHLLI